MKLGKVLVLCGFIIGCGGEPFEAKDESASAGVAGAAVAVQAGGADSATAGSNASGHSGSSFAGRGGSAGEGGGGSSDAGASATGGSLAHSGSGNVDAGGGETASSDVDCLAAWQGSTCDVCSTAPDQADRVGCSNVLACCAASGTCGPSVISCGFGFHYVDLAAAVFACACGKGQ